MSQKYSYFLLINSILLISICINEITSLSCYSCSSNSGDRFCHEDSFDETKLKPIECPDDADVCVRAIQKTGGAIFRACGISDHSKKKEMLMLGYYPPYNRCVQQKIGSESETFKDSVFEICGTSLNLGNTKGEIKFPSK